MSVGRKPHSFRLRHTRIERLPHATHESRTNDHRKTQEDSPSSPGGRAPGNGSPTAKHRTPPTHPSTSARTHHRQPAVITNHAQRSPHNAPRKTHNAKRKSRKTNPYFRMNKPNRPSRNPFETHLKANSSHLKANQAIRKPIQAIRKPFPTQSATRRQFSLLWTSGPFRSIGQPVSARRRRTYISTAGRWVENSAGCTTQQ
jgi:hypothetical protein